MVGVSSETKDKDPKRLLARIPAFPPIVMRLLDLLARDDVEIRELASLISADPAFSAQILCVANSPLFGFRAQISSLQSALVVLGLNRVRAVSMTVATANHMKAVLHVEELSRCWRHMLACALLTEELAHSCSIRDDRAYIAGLLHDVGRLGLLLAHPDKYAEILRDAERNGLDPLDCEREALGMDHCQAGRILAADWNLPPDFQVTAAHHHDAPTGPDADLLRLVQIGCKLADCLGFWVVHPRQPITAEEIEADLPEALRSRVHIDADRWREAVDKRIRCFGDPDGAVDSFAPLALVSREDPALPVDQLAKLRFPDPNATHPLVREIAKLLLIGLGFTLVIMAVVYFASRPS